MYKYLMFNTSSLFPKRECVKVHGLSPNVSINYAGAAIWLCFAMLFYPEQAFGPEGKGMGKRRQKVNPEEKMKYFDEIPPDMLEKLPPEIREQYLIWDEMFKRQIELYPSLLFPLLKEIFGKEYANGTDLKMLSKEYVFDRVDERGEKRMEAIRSDLLVRIGGRDLYHMECQIKRNGNMAVRMLEYDISTALVHGIEQVKTDTDGMIHKVSFPQSAVLYLDSTDRTPDFEKCIVIFQDGTKYEYRVPALKVQTYTPEMAAEKGLILLLPFFPIRFRRKFDAILKKLDDPLKTEKASMEMDALKKGLTNFIEECIMIIKREEENGTLSNMAGTDIVELMGKACDYLYGKKPEILREVHEVMRPAFKLVSEELREQRERVMELSAQLKRKDEQMSEQLRQKDEKMRQLEQENARLLQRIISLTVGDAQGQLKEC